MVYPFDKAVVSVRLDIVGRGKGWPAAVARPWMPRRPLPAFPFLQCMLVAVC